MLVTDNPDYTDGRRVAVALARARLTGDIETAHLLAAQSMDQVTGVIAGLIELATGSLLHASGSRDAAIDTLDRLALGAADHD
jgi:hypothetical protein